MRMIRGVGEMGMMGLMNISKDAGKVIESDVGVLMYTMAWRM
jgi:hypothetical protein